jgi:two-component system, LytTR family, sensor kinase
VFATWFIMWLAHRLRSAPRPLAWGVHVINALCVDVGLAAWTTFLVVTYHPFGPAFHIEALPHFLTGVYSNLHVTIIFYALILAMSAFFDSRDRLARQNVELVQLNEQLAQTQLSALRRQIEPHFLFNALNSIAGLIRENRPTEAISMLVTLSDFLRRTLLESNHQEVPLSEEIEFAKQYLAAQKVRFAERLQLSVDVPSALQSATVPNLLLQPLVENAIKHGIEKRKEGGCVRIVASTRDGRLHISVTNDGPPLSSGWESASSGVGVANVRARLKGLYGDAASFEMSSRSLGGVEVAIVMPLRVATT